MFYHGLVGFRTLDSESLVWLAVLLGEVVADFNLLRRISLRLPRSGSGTDHPFLEFEVRENNNNQQVFCLFFLPVITPAISNMYSLFLLAICTALLADLSTSQEAVADPEAACAIFREGITNCTSTTSACDACPAFYCKSCCMLVFCFFYT